MATSAEVLSYLIPTGGWAISGDDFENIYYDEGVQPITKKQFDDAFKIVDKVNADKKAANLIAKAALLDRLGLTAEEAVLLLSK